MTLCCAVEGAPEEPAVTEATEAAEKAPSTNVLADELLKPKPKTKTPLDQLVVGNWYEGRITGTAAYGAFVDIGAESDGLVHISELSTEFVSDVSAVVTQGDSIKVRVLSVDEAKKQLSLSVKPEGAAASPQRGGGRPKKAGAEELRKYLDADPEEFIEGTVRSVLSWGAFVNIAEGVDGLVHISRVSDDRVEDLESMLSEGDKVQVRIVDVDLEKGNLTLAMNTYRDASAPPPRRTRDDSSEKLRQYLDADPQQFIEGTVRTVLSWGAFVNIAEGVDGLVHISRVSDDRVEDLESILSPGDKVQVRIEEVDLQKGTLALAMNTYRDPSTLPPRRSNDDGESAAARRARDPQAGFGGQRRPSRRDPGDDIWDNTDSFEWKEVLEKAENEDDMSSGFVVDEKGVLSLM